MGIDKIILKLLNKTESLEELEVLESWKAESMNNIAFLNMLNTSNMTEEPFNQYDKEKAWKSIESKIEAPYGNSVLKWSLLAAFVVILLGMAYYFSLQVEKLKVYNSDEVVAHHILQDNSEIWLNSNSTLNELAFFEQERKVGLQGEAFFDISPNKENPFIIQLDDKSFIKVVGTSFNVVNKDTIFDLSVYTGVVELHTLNRVISLKRGERVRSYDGAYVKTLIRDPNLISWKSNSLIFENTPLVKVFEAIGRHFQANIDIDENIDFSNCFLHSNFDNQGLREILDEMSKLFALEYTIDKSNVLIKSIQCN